MFSSSKIATFVMTGALLWLCACPCFGMGGNPQSAKSNPAEQASVATSDVTLKEMADMFWPDSAATQLQQQEFLAKVLGKTVTWEVEVAEIQQHDEHTYLVQSSSTKDALGVFAYVAPQNDAELKMLQTAARGSKLKIAGVIKGEKLRHMVLEPATLKMQN